MVLVSIIGLVLGIGAYLLGNVLLAIYNSDPEVIAYGLNRLAVVSAPYFLCGLMDVLCGSMRGMGYSIIPMIVSLIGSCVFRVVWIFTIFAIYHTQFVLYLSYPISWALTAIVHFICYLFIRKKVFGSDELTLAHE